MHNFILGSFMFTVSFVRLECFESVFCLGVHRGAATTKQFQCDRVDYIGCKPEFRANFSGLTILY